MKTHLIVQARMGSTRLPGKVLRPFCGKPMLQFLMDRLKLVELADKIIVATTENPEDDAIELLAESMGWYVFRGSEKDVLGRFANAAKKYGSDIIIRISADNPLVDPEIVDRVISYLKFKEYSHVSTFEEPSYPYGVGCAGFTYELLEKADRNAESDFEREHVEPYMLKNTSVQTCYLKAPEAVAHPEICVTVDEEFEFEKVENIAKKIIKKHGIHFTTRHLVQERLDVRVLAVANGRLGLECVEYMVRENENLCGLIVHPPHQCRMRDEIIHASALSDKDIFTPDSLNDQAVFGWIKERRPDLITSLWASYIFPKDIIELIPRGVTNLHNSLLPLARGGEANIWTILDGHEAGGTLHYITPEIDKGPVIDMRKTECNSWDTGQSLYYRLEELLITMFKENWKYVKTGKVKTRSQVGKGSYHGYRASDPLRKIDLDEKYTARDLFNLLRAFSFPPYEGAYFYDDNGNRINVNIALNKGIR